MLGMNFNYGVMINNELIEFRFRFISFEFNYCTAYCCTLMAPLIAISKEPTPSICVWILFGIQMLAVLSMKFEEKKDSVDKNIREYINNSVVNSLVHSQMFLSNMNNKKEEVVSQWKMNKIEEAPSSESDDG